MSEIPNKYDPKAAETKWQSYWAEQQTYARSTERETIPFPLIRRLRLSGSLHIGHCFLMPIGTFSFGIKE